MFNYDTIIKQLEAMSPIHQDEFAQKLMDWPLPYLLKLILHIRISITPILKQWNNLLNQEVMLNEESYCKIFNVRLCIL